MGWPSRSRGRRRSLSAALLVVIIFFAAALTGTCTPVSGSRGGGVAPEEEYTWDPVTTAARRGLVGPGSSPPTCYSRCGGCHPCRPVHVAIQPGRSFPLEYYPEAWRCKCGNKFFMP